jgi:hypothetical protein
MLEGAGLEPTGGSFAASNRDEPSMSISSTTIDQATVGPMKDPPPPGEIVREEVIRPLGLSATAPRARWG